MIKPFIAAILFATICSQAYSAEKIEPKIHVTYKSYYWKQDIPGVRVSVMKQGKLKKFNESLSELKLKDTILDTTIIGDKVFSEHSNLPIIEGDRTSFLYSGYDLGISSKAITKRKFNIKTQLNQNFVESLDRPNSQGVIDPKNTNVNFDAKLVAKKGKTIVFMAKSKGGMFYVLEETLEK